MEFYSAISDMAAGKVWFCFDSDVDYFFNQLVSLSESSKYCILPNMQMMYD